MTHFIEKCKYCNIVISQCRCPSQDKIIKYGICQTCKEKEKLNDNNISQYSI
jgi:hypothetical protein